MTTITPQPSTEAAPGAPAGKAIVSIAEVGRADVPIVGGKGANLGEMTAAGLPVPSGFILTTKAYRQFFDSNTLAPRVATELARVAPDDTAALDQRAAALHQLVLDAKVPDDLRLAIEQAYEGLAKEGSSYARVAVRSSATVEDTAQFSFAGMFESFLNVSDETALLDAVKKCWASAFQARALFYRIKQGLPADISLAVIVQRMVNSEKSGVMFTADPATHDASRIVIEAAWGLGEVVVHGAVTPDRHVLDKRSLAVVETQIATKEFLLTWDASTHATVRIDLTGDARAKAPVLSAGELAILGALARRAEEHYHVAQDLEFAIEGTEIFLTQTRPITTRQRPAEGGARAPGEGATVLVRGLGASPGRATGAVRVLASPGEGAAMLAGEILVTRMTSPDWVPIMRRAVAIITDSGGMTSHAAIVARELGLPCIVGTHNATRVLATGNVVTVDGQVGAVLAGAAEGPATPAPAPPPAPAPNARATTAGPVTATRLYVNLAEPERAAEVALQDVDGVGLLRAEFMMLEVLEHMHPSAFLAQRSADEFVRRMAEGVRVFARAFAPRPVVYRAMDFRTNEFRDLTGGAAHEPIEANPMIGYRGCLRYTREPDLFALELRALADVRRDFDNLHLMIPFVRTPRELEACLTLVAASPLGADARLERWIMAEVPSVVTHLAAYASMGITGVSIGSNDLTQLLLGVDRDSELFGSGYDERDPAVLDAIRSIIRQCHRLGLTCSICGQAPSVHADYAASLVEWGIDSISVNADAIDRTRRSIAVAEQRLILQQARARSSERGLRTHSGAPEQGEKEAGGGDRDDERSALAMQQ